VSQADEGGCDGAGAKRPACFGAVGRGAGKGPAQLLPEMSCLGDPKLWEPDVAAEMMADPQVFDLPSVIIGQFLPIPADLLAA